MFQGLKSFILKINPDDKEMMAELQDISNELAESTNLYIENLAKEFGLTENQAGDVWYLRTRSRHTDELEARLVRAMKAGHSISMCEDTDQELTKIGF